MLHDLRNEIDRYLVGRSSLLQLESWLVSHLQLLLDSGDARLIDVANSLDADFVEFGEGLLSEASMRRHLDAYLRSAETVMLNEQREHEVTTGAAVNTIMVSGLEMPERITTIHLPILRVA
jgi:tRNA isopentenyl-2-thiomethyl-A-37 hydroxylase MiaE